MTNEQMTSSETESTTDQPAPTPGTDSLADRGDTEGNRRRIERSSRREI